MYTDLATRSAVRRKVLVVDDDVENREYLTLILSEEYDVATATDGEDALQVARVEQPDVVLLDLLMPKMDGLRACQGLRANDSTRHIPIIVLTGSDDSERRVRAFANGADDFVMKPFRPRELLARISSKIRRVAESETRRRSQILKIGNLALNIDALEARIAGQPIELSLLEFNLLRFFVDNVDRVVSRERILSSVWRDAVVTDRTVDTHMVSLRKKLRDFDGNLSTIYGAGYVLKSLGSPPPPGLEPAPDAG